MDKITLHNIIFKKYIKENPFTTKQYFHQLCQATKVKRVRKNELEYLLLICIIYCYSKLKSLLRTWTLNDGISGLIARSILHSLLPSHQKKKIIHFIGILSILESATCDETTRCA